ncbi:MAG TPA: hypothetical protein VIF62_26215 [Labilithrix sp.]|jgi:hypothetical protein
MGAALGVCAAIAWGAPASASTATFFPVGSSAHVDREHVTVAVTASATVTWTTIDVGGDASDFGFIVAVKAGGRVEIAADAWIDVVERATAVVVTTVSPSQCKPLGGGGGVVVGGGASGEAGVSGSGTADSNGGCGGSGGGNVGIEGGGGGCWSRTADNGGCGGCGSCTPSESGHPGCSALSSCAPASEGKSSSSSSGGPTDGSPGPTTQVGPYELVRVHASDGSAAAWVAVNGYDPGVSFAQSLGAVEAAGYDLYAVRSRAPASAIRSLRVVTTSPSPTFPLRMLRTGATSRVPSTPVTLVVLGANAQELGGVQALRVDTSMLSGSGTSTNYEALVSALLGASDGGDAGAETRWVLEDTRTLLNRRSGDAGDASTIADDFFARCQDSRETDTVCGSPIDGGDAAIPDAGDAGPLDAGDAGDAGPSDAGETDASPPGCTEVDRAACDDIDLAIEPSTSAVATRFRAVVAGDPAAIADLAFTAAADAIGEGVFTVRDDGVAGLCEPVEGVSGSGSVSASASGVGDATCRQTRMRPFGVPQLGPLFLVLAAIRAVTLIMRRARRRK